MLKKLFTPLRINGCEIPNRLVVPAMVTNYNNEDGTITERYIRYHEEKAKGGWGLIITEDYAVNEHAKGYKFIAGLFRDDQIFANRKLTERIHQYESKIFCQIYHPGRQSTHLVNGGVQPIAPSAIPCPLCRELPREITIDEIHMIVQQFGETALRVKKAGFDGVEIHGAHGYLLSEFLSPYSNKRVDEYGGCFENRTRFLREIMGSVRSKVGTDFPVIIRISLDEFIDGGRTIAESLELAVLCEELGFDAINATQCVYGGKATLSMHAPKAFIIDMVEQIKKAVSIPVVATNCLNDPKMSDVFLQMGKADFIGMARGSLADPYLPAKAKAGFSESIRYCIGCMGCFGSTYLNVPITCTVNPELGLEYQMNHDPVSTPKNIMVVGAGPGGMEAAYIAAGRGHKVTIYEKSNNIGGQFRSAAYPPGKGILASFTSWIRRELEELHVEIKLNTEVTETLIKSAKPDTIILATGGLPVKPKIPGIDKKHVFFAEDVLVGNVATTDNIVVCGGGEVGSETAALLAQEARRVNIVEMLPSIISDTVLAHDIMKILTYYQVGIHTNSKVVEITDDSVVCEGANGKLNLPASTVVLAFGYKPNTQLEDTAKSVCKDVFVIGGAAKTGNAIEAISEGYSIGMKL
jgi:2,4-dienoyl-CoA reductase-like NADH-dependent reductase (Old Yellow Enzyme family)/thioredoxin reductase